MKNQILLEMPACRIRKPNLITLRTETGRMVQADQLDMRFEDMATDKFFIPSGLRFVAKLPYDDGWLANDGKIYGDNDKPEYPELPKGWDRYVVGVLNGRLVKAPLKPRAGQGELDQHAIDAQSANESLLMDLDRVFS